MPVCQPRMQQSRLDTAQAAAGIAWTAPRPVSTLGAMKTRLALRIVVAAALAGMAVTVASANDSTQPAVSDESKFPPRLKRADSFLGIHYDFHAGPDCTEIGKNTTRSMIENIITQVRPDYIQIDCKGHRGLSSYPTQVGHQAPGFVGDPLRLWRQVTAEHGVALYMHYSGVWDSEAIIRHPDWAAINADGKVNGNATSFFGPYADRLLIPQLRELAGDYGVDGVWVDGECWASVPDYGPAALSAFRQATGITDVPRKPGDPHWFEFLQFHREAFRRYLRYYIAEVKRTHPGFQICSNWAYTDHMAEPVSAPLDFLSGDYSPDDSVNSARLSARYLARQGKPWDLMAWSFSRRTGRTGTNDKTAVQLQREAAVVLALGGGFQAYFKQKRDGSVFDERVPVMAEVAKFCRARQAVCHRAEMVPQIALLLSTAGHYRRINGLFSRDLSRVSGVLQALVESRRCVEVLGEHHLAGRMNRYPLIIVPEWDYLDPAFRDDLRAYVEGGGSLLLIGPGSAAMFADVLDVTFDGSRQSQPRFLSHKESLAATQGPLQSVKPGPRAQAVGRLYTDNNPDSVSQPAASIAPLGKGRVAAVYFSLGQTYAATRGQAIRGFLDDLVNRLFPDPIVRVEGSDGVDVSLAANHGKLLIHLVNTAGPHQSEPVIETIPPIGPLAISIRRPARPSSITLEPAGQSLPFEFADGLVRLTVPRVDIHDIVVLADEP